MLTTEEIVGLIRSAGEFIRLAHKIEEQSGMIGTKAGSANFVTKYDLEVQKMLIDGLSALIPDAKFLAEEKNNAGFCANHGVCFVIDPIDGTTNFIHDYKCSAISVGMLWDGVPTFGAVYNPYRDEMFTATRGKGAFLNGEPIRVSRREIDNSIALVGTSPYDKLVNGEKSIEIIKRLFYTCADIRRSGSAAIDLCNIACGRADVFCELKLSPWDFSAGGLIVSEAGGIICDLSGNDLPLTEASSVFASNRECYEKAFESVRAFGG